MRSVHPAALLLAMGTIFFGVGRCEAKERYDWKSLGSDHFLVYFLGEENFAKDVLDHSEEYYRDIAGALGYPRYSEFWLWNRRVKIYVYPDKRSFLEATGQPEWSEGMADYKLKQIVSYAWSHGFIESLLPHEMAHLIFRDFVGFKGEVPTWLDEGVAQWSEEKKRDAMRAVVLKKFEEDALLSIEDMMKIDIRRLGSGDKLYIRSNVTKSGERGILFLNAEGVVNAYYLQGFALVDFLIGRYGTDDFTYFCRQLRDGKGIEEALRFAYPSRIRDLRELESEWRKHLEETRTQPPA